MLETADMDLVREYARNDSDEAFAALVTRHVNLVYSAALRKTGNPAAAEEVTQVVFIVLARKAAGLRPGTILSGWLYQTARMVSANFLRTEIRRARREQEAFMQSPSEESAPAECPEILPLLEDAMGALNEKDRNAIALRFFDGCNFSEVGAALGTSEDAAKMRVNRALERLRRFFTRRGVTSTALGIAATISAHSAQAAPAGLAQSITVAATAKGVGATTATLTLVKGALKLMAWTKIKTTVVGGAVLLLVAGTATPLILHSVHAARTRAALAPMKGEWEGTLETGPAKLRLVVRIVATNGAYAAFLDSVDQGANNIPVATLSARPHFLHAELPALGVVYDATLSDDENHLTGTFTQMKRAFPLTLNRTTAAERADQPLPPDAYIRTPSSDLQGAWAGTLKVGGAELHLNLRIAEPGPGTFHAQMDSLDQGVKNIPITTVTYHRPDIRFEIESLNGVFEGTVDAGADKLSGEWTQMGKKLPLVFQRADTNAAPAADLDYGTGKTFEVMGHWKGVLKVQQMELHLGVNIGRTPDGLYDATMDSPDQGASGIPATTADFTYPHLRAEWKSIGGVLTAKLSGGQLDGTWRQGKVTLPLKLVRDPGN